MPFELCAVNSPRTVPIPYIYPEDTVQIGESAESHVVHMFPAVVREAAKPTPKVDQLANSGATCFYHENNPAVAICDESGRLICELCKTEWEGRIVSVQALQELMSGKIRRAKIKGRCAGVVSYCRFSCLPACFSRSLF